MSADRSEYAYIKSAAGHEHWTNLAPWLQQTTGIAVLSDDPRYHQPCEALDVLRARHPRARTAPPYRALTLRLQEGCPLPLTPHQEVVVFRPEGYFVGFVVVLSGLGREGWTRLTLWEAAAVLARGCCWGEAATWGDPNVWRYPTACAGCSDVVAQLYREERGQWEV